jgi:hypothetical protein
MFRDRGKDGCSATLSLSHTLVFHSGKVTSGAPEVSHMSFYQSPHDGEFYVPA